MTSPALKRIYEGLDMKCPSCSKLVALADIENHKNLCGKPKCWNSDVCSGYEDPSYAKNCSEQCLLLQKLLYLFGDSVTQEATARRCTTFC